ncbi:NodT family efflux transporter outer membrane factor (OMF) lipoprotein [Paraburkholderia sp. GV068]|jgi:NodT family efflux transporter outer membrane factor (OMF) lipoprotein|nr:RND transporter [Paraburkholderia graminis]PTR04098.1 NodT family efflux transporter outer membrane factor (OMF) lipoprotein [Paraburkholderia sp. GV072]PUB09055.1 NodT family efflux transporter outer membrane factor (OMF) lipoprotein [Paraburkholderia sp. GV068]
MIFTTAVARGLMCVSGSHSEAGNLRHEPHDGAPYLPEISGAKPACRRQAAEDGRHTVMRRPSTSLLRVICVGVAIATGLGACAVGPDYAAPTTQLVPFHNRVETSTQQAARPSPHLDTWWTGFDDPMLVTVVQRALAQNLDLAAAFARVQQARAVAAGAGAQLLPTLDFDATGTAEHQSLLSPVGTIAKTFPGYSRDQREYNVGATASWEIDLAGGLRRSAAAARDEVQAAEAEQLGTRITVAADAADAYLQVRGFQTRLAVAQDQIDTDGRLLELVRVRRRAGAADEREIAQAEALLKQARSTVPILRTSLEAQLNRLDVLMGAQPGTYAHELSVSSTIPAIPKIDDNDQPLDVLRRRPDIIAAERRVAASSERIGAAISGYYPKISLSGALGFDSVSTNHLFTAAAFQPVGTGALRWRLFDFGKVDAEVKQARGANAEALALYRQAVLKAAEDVENAFTALSQTEARRQELQDEVASLTRARDLSERAYRAGAITLTDVLDADRQLLVARDDLDSSRADAARAAVGAFRALGGGWDISPDARVATNSSPPAVPVR